MFPLLYHTHHCLHNDDLPFWLELAQHHPGPILELGCGTGRVLLPLLQAGYPAYGLDSDLPMLQYLHSSLPPGLRSQPPIFLADMAVFRLAKQFSLVILPCNTLSTLAPAVRQAAFLRIKENLAPEGTFAASLPNPLVLAEMSRRGAEEVEETFIHPLTGNPVQVSSAWVRGKELFTVTWHYDHLLPDGGVERVTTRVKHSLETQEIYASELRQAGLQITASYGDFDRSPYTFESPNLVLIASRN
jgi:SAM-dependent methyltransferase